MEDEVETDTDLSKECVLTLCNLEVHETFMIKYLKDVIEV